MATRRTSSDASVASHGIAASLRQQILSGELPPGTRILQEEVAERHNASRLPVREAIRMLAAEELLTLESNRGAWVTQLSLDECIELYKIREQLEVLLLEASVPHLTVEDIAELETLMVKMEGVVAVDIEEFLAVDRDFHLGTYKRAGLPYALGMVEQLLARTQHYRRGYALIVESRTDRDWILQYDHRLIVDAIKRGDSKEAATIMRLHTRRARLELVHHPEIFASVE